MEELLAKYKIKDEVIAVGVSGGADSLALVLKAVEELTVFGYKIVALTVNHQMRPSADKEAEYVAEVMKKHGIEHHILVWQHEKTLAVNEDMAREARYRLISEWCLENGVRVLMTAHHLQDQAETFLMRLQRGSGLEGLSSIREFSQRDGLIILRPLLGVEPSELRAYLKAKNVEWVEDESNANHKFLRNKIRAFLPLLFESTGINERKICEAVRNLQSAEEYIESQVQQTLQNDVRCLGDNVCSFKYTSYLKWHKEIKFRVLASLCRRQYIPRADSVLSLIERLDKLPFAGATLGGKEVLLSYGNVWVVPELTAKHKETRKRWKEFEQSNPLVKGQKIPHKVKLAMLQNQGETNDNL